MRGTLKWDAARPCGGQAGKGIKHEAFMRDMNAFGDALLGLGLARQKVAVIGPTSYEWLVFIFQWYAASA